MGDVGVLLRRLDLGERSLGIGLLAGNQIGMTEADLAIGCILQRLLEARLDDRDGILGLACFAEHVLADLDQVVAHGSGLGGGQRLGPVGGVGGGLGLGQGQQAVGTIV